MRLLFVADGRSPIALNWIRHFAQDGSEVYLASTFDCRVDLPLEGYEFTPVAFSRPRSSAQPAPAANSTAIARRSALRHLLGPLTIPRAARRLRDLQLRIKPDLVHAMRIPFEGMLAADAYTGVPLLISVWGNDFTLHAPATWPMRHYTTWAMGVAHALHTDCRRDIRLSRQWGFAHGKPTLVVPGNGGVRMDIFKAPPQPVEHPVVLNPRGARAYVRNDVFFRAIPLVLARVPRARFLCASLKGDRQAMQLVERLGIASAVDLLPRVVYNEMAALYRRAQVAVSPALHDGTPNSLLEAMACGCLPVAGDLESIREWINDGQNGLLVNPTDPESLAAAIIRALEDKSLRRQAASLNHDVILERAEYTRCMAQAEAFYQRIVSGS